MHELIFWSGLFALGVITIVVGNILSLIAALFVLEKLPNTLNKYL